MEPPAAGGLMAWAASTCPDSSQLYRWLADREERGAANGFRPVSSNPDGTGSWEATPQRLADLRAGRPVDLPVGDLPPWARPAGPVRWWHRATVSADGSLRFHDDSGEWLAENGL